MRKGKSNRYSGGKKSLKNKAKRQKNSLTRGGRRGILREDIVLQPDESSLTNEMMKMFKEGIVK